MIEHLRVAKARSITLEVNAREAGAISERIAPDVGNAVGDRNGGQAVAGLELVVPDAGNAVGDRDTCYAQILERRNPDTCHRQTVYRAWDGHNEVRARVSRN